MPLCCAQCPILVIHTVWLTHNKPMCTWTTFSFLKHYEVCYKAVWLSSFPLLYCVCPPLSACTPSRVLPDGGLRQPASQYGPTGDARGTNVVRRRLSSYSVSAAPNATNATAPTAAAAATATCRFGFPESLLLH